MPDTANITEPQVATPEIGELDWYDPAVRAAILSAEDMVEQSRIKLEDPAAVDRIIALYVQRRVLGGGIDDELLFSEILRKFGYNKSAETLAEFHSSRKKK